MQKILSITSLMFLLPDDFAGDLNDALHELANYQSSCKGKPSSSRQPLKLEWHTKPFIEVNTLMFDEFMEQMENGRRLTGLFQIKECKLTPEESE